MTQRTSLLETFSRHKETEMLKHALIAIGGLLSTFALAQDEASKKAIEKWRQCADATAARYSKTTESAPVVARLAAFACAAEKKQANQAVTANDGSAFADEYISSAERYYIDRLSVKIIEMRLEAAGKR